MPFALVIDVLTKHIMGDAVVVVDLRLGVFFSHTEARRLLLGSNLVLCPSSCSPLHHHSFHLASEISNRTDDGEDSGGGAEV